MYAFECRPPSYQDNRPSVIGTWLKSRITHGDELPDEAEFAQLPDIVLHVLLAEASSVPVEGRAQVVSEPVAGADGMNTLGKLLGLLRV